MTKIIFAFVVLCAFYAETVWGQDRAVINSLKRKLETAKGDTLKAKLWADLSFQYTTIAPDTAVLYGKHSLAIAQKTGDRNYIAFSLMLLGLGFDAQDDYPKALASYQQSLKLYKAMEGRTGQLADVLSCIGSVHSEQGNYIEAFDAFQQSLKLYETIGQKQQAGVMLFNIGNVYAWHQESNRALEYYQKSLKMVEGLKNASADIAITLAAIGGIYSDIRNFPLALEYYQKSRKLLEIDKDRYAGDLGLVLLNIGEVYLHQLDYAQALNFFQQSIAYYIAANDIDGTSYALHNLGGVYLRLSNTQEALRYNTQAVAIALQIGSKQTIMECFKTRYQIDSVLGDNVSALKHYKLHIAYKDSLFNEEKTKEIGKLEGKYEIEKAQEAEKRKQEAEAKETERQNNLQYLLIFAGVATFFLGLFFIGRLKLPLILSEGLIFLAFLMLFEYILIVTEPFLEQYTGGVPIQKLGLNIVLAAIFTPLHKFLEGRLKKTIIK